MKSYQAYLDRQQKKYGDKFDTSDLNPDFIPYYENQKRIEVDFGYETKKGRIGVTTGWRPCFLLMLTTRSLGSVHLIDRDSAVVRGKFIK